MQSLEVRGKGGKSDKSCAGSGLDADHQSYLQAEVVARVKRRRNNENQNEDEDRLEMEKPVAKRAKPTSTKRQTTLSFVPKDSTSHVTYSRVSKTAVESRNISSTIHKISAHPTLTTYRKRLYATLMSVPPGRYTTYGALSEYLNSAARAVGNGLRNNPFAPEVPCHRVLAFNGSIGGFGGDWGKEGKHANQKIQLLRDEGVGFDGKGTAIGAPFTDFVDLLNIVDH